MAFTKRGDAGETDLYNQTRHPKSALYFECVGDLDELSAHLGIVKSYLPDTPVLRPGKISVIQQTLLQLGSHLATPPTETMTRHQEQRVRDTVFDPEGELVRSIEAWTQEDYKRLPPLKTFLLPGPDELAAYLHVARTVCRRAERHIVALAEQNPNTVNPQALQYINRLSSLLFVWARVEQELPKNEFEKEDACLQWAKVAMMGFGLIFVLVAAIF
jgi:cob(I)alamin adenosyltransferase